MEKYFWQYGTTAILGYPPKKFSTHCMFLLSLPPSRKMAKGENSNFFSEPSPS